MENFRDNTEVGDKIKAVMAREVDGETKEIKMKAKAMAITVDVASSIEIDPGHYGAGSLEKSVGGCC